MDRQASSSSLEQRTPRRKNKQDRRERQIVRVLALLRVLSQGRTPSVQDLAAEFRTRRETIYRDLRVLQDAGYPITGDDRGRLSHPRLLTRSVPEIRFSAPELEAMRAAAAQVKVALPSSDALDAATVKLEALLKSERGGLDLASSEIIESWTCGSKEHSFHERHIALLVEAILRRRRCHVEYQKPASDAPKDYDFDPYRLLLADGGLYVLGKVPKYEGVATLSVDRLISVTLTALDFAVDTHFDPNQCRQQAFGVSRQDPEQIVLRFRADQAPYVRERFWHPTQQLTTLADGGLEMTFHAGGPFEIRRWILGWGDAVEVISPDGLRREVQRTTGSAAALYGSQAD